MMDKVAVVILNYNGRGFLEKFLPKVVSCSQEASIWVIDNASTDSSLKFLSDSYPGLRVVALTSNLGYAGGYQEGLRSIGAEYYVLLNSDVEVTNGWLEPMLQLLENDPFIAACQPKMLSHHLRDSFEYAGAAGGFIDMLGYPFCRGRVFDNIEIDNGQYNDTREIFWATGACLFVRSSAYQKVGGLDHRFFAHMEEIDLCWRFKMEGFKVYYQGLSVVYHVGGGTLDSGNPFKTYLNFRNSILMLIKNDSRQSLYWKVPLRFVIDFLILLRLVLAGNFRGASAISKAHVFVVKNLKEYTKNRARKNLATLTGCYRGISPLAYTFGQKEYQSLEGRIVK